MEDHFVILGVNALVFKGAGNFLAIDVNNAVSFGDITGVAVLIDFFGAQRQVGATEIPMTETCSPRDGKCWN